MNVPPPAPDEIPPVTGESDDPVLASLGSDGGDAASNEASLSPSEARIQSAVPDGLVVASVGDFRSSPPSIPLPVDDPPEFQNLAAVGGAIGSVVLGVSSIIGSLITPYSMINGILGLGLACWGVQSPRKRLTAVGLVASFIGLLMSGYDVSEWVSDLLTRSQTS